MEIDMEKLADQLSRDQLISDFKVVIADAEALLEATENVCGDKLSVIRAKAEESLNIVKGRMLNAQTMAIARAREAVKITDEYVHENPWKAIGGTAGVGLAIGVLIGLLIGRR